MPHQDHEGAPFDTDHREHSSNFSPILFGQPPARDSYGESAIETPISTKQRLKDSGRGSIGSRRESEADGDLTRASVPVQKVKGYRMGIIPIFVPGQALRNGWDIAYDLLILYSLCTSTYYLAYEHPGTGLFAFDVFVWVFFIVDIFITFNTGYLDDHNHLVTSRRHIAIRYISTWFFIDLIALLPFSFGDNPEVEYYLRLLRFLRLPDSVNFVDGTGVGALFSMVFNILPEIKIGDYVLSYYYVSLACQQIFRMVVWSYFLACIFYWYAKHTGPESVYTSLWFDDSAKLAGSASDIKLLHSWYFMLTTLMTIGYGDFLPLSFCEKILIIVILVIGIANFSLIMGSFVSLISEFNEVNSGEDVVNQVSIWMDLIEASGHTISLNVKTRVLKYYQTYAKMDRLGSLCAAWWNAESADDLSNSGDSMFNDLPEQTRHAIIDYLFSDLFQRYKSFFFLPYDFFAYSLALHFQPRLFDLGEIILKENDEVTEVLLLMKGSVACEFKAVDQHHQFLFFTNKLVLGDYNVLTSTHSQFTFRAMEAQKVKMMAIPSKAFCDILDSVSDCDHKKNLFKKAASFTNIVRKTMQDYMKKNSIPQFLPRSTTFQISSRLFIALVKKDPALQYEDIVQFT